MAGVVFLALVSGLIAQSFAAAPYCVPGEPCFPSAAELAAFNQSVSGRLFAPPPYGQVCYQGHFDPAACALLIQNHTDEVFRESIPAAMVYTNNEFDENGNGCPLPASNLSMPITNATCELGALGTYFVNVTTEQDISLAVQFAAKYNLRLRVKNVSPALRTQSTIALMWIRLWPDWA